MVLDCARSVSSCVTVSRQSWTVSSASEGSAEKTSAPARLGRSSSIVGPVARADSCTARVPSSDVTSTAAPSAGTKRAASPPATGAVARSAAASAPAPAATTAITLTQAATRRASGMRVSSAGEGSAGTPGFDGVWPSGSGCVIGVGPPSAEDISADMVDAATTRVRVVASGVPARMDACPPRLMNRPDAVAVGRRRGVISPPHRRRTEPRHPWPSACSCAGARHVRAPGGCRIAPRR